MHYCISCKEDNTTSIFEDFCPSANRITNYIFFLLVFFVNFFLAMYFIFSNLFIKLEGNDNFSLLLYIFNFILIFFIFFFDFYCFSIYLKEFSRFSFRILSYIAFFINIIFFIVSINLRKMILNIINFQKSNSALGNSGGSQFLEDINFYIYMCSLGMAINLILLFNSIPLEIYIILLFLFLSMYIKIYFNYKKYIMNYVY